VEVEEQIEQTLAKVFKNYRSLDDSILLGLTEDFRSLTGLAVVAAMNLYQVV
jgi:hypothetical protein